MVTNLDDIYDVGTFVQITELHEVGDRMRMIIQGHRRCVCVCVCVCVRACMYTCVHVRVCVHTK